MSGRVLLGAASLLMGCGDLPVAYERVPASATASFTSQTVLVGSPVFVPPSVLVRDHLGDPLAGVPVHFVASAGGTLATPEAVTDAAGIASAGSWTIGTGSETSFATATVDGISGGSVTFTARAIAIKQVGAGSGHTCASALGSPNEVYCWGSNSFGQTGSTEVVGTNLNVGRRASTPTLTFVAGGLSHSCGLNTNGATLCWGRNNLGQLGDATTFTRSYSGMVIGGQTFTHLAVGADHSCGITAGGVAYCWGSNSSGQLGDGSNVNRHVPVAVSGGLNFQQIAAHGNHTCAIGNTNVTYCWGENANGGLGDGTKLNRNTPTAISGGQVFKSLALGSLHSCGLVSDGTAYCWGANQSGQLGDGTTTERLTPTAVSGGIAFASLASYAAHTCGLTSVGGLAWCWGDNTSGQLGDGTKANRASPVAVLDGRQYTQLTTGGAHTCAVVPGGQAFCWGANASGQLADGTFIERLAPVLIRLR